MNPFWGYFWPPFAAALFIGAMAGLIAFRRRGQRNRALLVGVTLTIALTLLWHGPFEAADRFAVTVEKSARATLDEYEMTQVTAHLHHGPLTRGLLLAGPADDFQSSQLVKIMGSLPGVREASWSSDSGGIPLIIEGIADAILGFVFGLVLGYLIELRRRYNAQWNW